MGSRLRGNDIKIRKYRGHDASCPYGKLGYAASLWELQYVEPFMIDKGHIL